MKSLNLHSGSSTQTRTLRMSRVSHSLRSETHRVAPHFRLQVDNRHGRMLASTHMNVRHAPTFTEKTTLSLSAALPTARNFEVSIATRDRSCICLAATAPAPPPTPTPAPNPDMVHVEGPMHLPGSKLKFNVTVGESSVVNAIKDTLKGLEKSVKVPGFRPGKPVNEKILINYVGKDKVMEEAAETLLLRNMKHALQEVEGEAIKDTERVITTRKEIIDMVLAAWEARNSQDNDLSILGVNPFTFDIEVEVAPEVKWKGDYNAITVDVVVPCGEGDNSESDEAGTGSGGEARRRTNTLIKNRLKELGVMRVVTERGIELGDVVVVSTEGFKINEDGSKGDEILAARQERFKIDTNEDLSSYIPGFIENILYMKAGETKDDIKLTFPDTWVIESLQNIDSVWSIKVLEHFGLEIPEESDEIATKIQPGMKTMEELRAHLDKINNERIVKEADDIVDQALLDQVSNLIDFDIPEALVQEHGQQMYLQKLIQMQSMGKLSSEQLAQLANRQMVDNFISAKREEIVQSVSTTLAVEDIFNKEEMEIQREELEEEMQTAKLDFDKNGMRYDEARLEEQAEEILIGRKVLQHLRSKSNINKTYQFTESK